VRRYGVQAALDDETGQGRVPPMPFLYEFADRQHEYGVLLVVLDAPNMLAGKGVEVAGLLLGGDRQR
jgi:hypothetical protein